MDGDIADLRRLYAALVKWGVARGAKTLCDYPGVWRDEAPASPFFGPLTVSMNGHDEIIDDIPPYNIELRDEDGEVVALIGINGGVIATDREEDLARHFQMITTSQTPSN